MPYLDTSCSALGAAADDRDLISVVMLPESSLESVGVQANAPELRGASATERDQWT